MRYGTKYHLKKFYSTSPRFGRFVHCHYFLPSLTFAVQYHAQWQRLRVLRKYVLHCLSCPKTSLPTSLTNICGYGIKFWAHAKAQNKESGKTELYLLISIIILISYIIIQLLIKTRTIPAKTGNGTLFRCFWFVDHHSLPHHLQLHHRQ